MMASVICILVAYGLITIAGVFAKRKGVFYFVSTLLSLLLAIIACMICANYTNNFSGFSIILTSSIIPLLFMLYEPIHPQFQKAPETIGENVQELVFNSGWIKVKEDEEIDEKQQKTSMTDKNGKTLIVSGKKPVSVLFCESKGLFFNAIGLLISAFLIAFAGLYISKESPFSFLCAIPMGLLGFALSKILEKKKGFNIFDHLSATFFFAGAGFLIGQIVAIVIYSLKLRAIFFCVGCLLVAVYSLIKCFIKSHRINIILNVGILFIIMSILF